MPTTKTTTAASRAWKTRRINQAWIAAHAAEAASKAALKAYCEQRDWRVASFEGKPVLPARGSSMPSRFGSLAGEAKRMNWNFA